MIFFGFGFLWKVQFSNFEEENGNSSILLKTKRFFQETDPRFPKMPTVITLIRRWFDYRLYYRDHAQARSSLDHAQLLD
jgi:hypothetical protein